MCRIFMANNKFINKTKKEEMLALLDQLQKSCGGHGNGIAFVTGGEVVFSYKDLALTNEEIVEMLYHKKTTKPEWFFYHTRVASAGSIKSENCHPYVNEDNTFMLQMNGTEYDFGLLGKDKDITDTEVIFDIYNKTGYDVAGLRLLSPRFMGLSKGKVFATNPSHSPLKFYNEDGAFAIASEFEATRDNVKTMKKSYIWREGEEILEEPTPTYKTYEAYSRYDDGFGHYLGNKHSKNSRWFGVSNDCEACTVTVDEVENIEEDPGVAELMSDEVEAELTEWGLDSFKSFSKATISEATFQSRMGVLEEICRYYLPDRFYAFEIIKHFFTNNLTVCSEDGTKIEYDIYSDEQGIVLDSKSEKILVDTYGSFVLKK